MYVLIICTYFAFVFPVHLSALSCKVKSSTTGEVTNIPLPLGSGGIPFDTTEHSVQFTDFSESGVGALFLRNTEDAREISNSGGSVAASTAPPARRRRDAIHTGRHLLQITTATINVPAIRNAIVCVGQNDAVVFRINPPHYPTYVKNHLLNSNPSFDDGPFRRLKSNIDANLQVSSFVHIFTESGTYVFANSNNTLAEVIVSVRPPGVACATNASISPANADTLTNNNITLAANLNQAPDWALIYAVVGTIGGIVFLLIVAVALWRPRHVGLQAPRALQPRYRPVAATPVVVYAADDDNPEKEESRLGPRGQPVGCERVEGDGTDGLLEDFNVRTLYDKLEDQNLHVATQLAQHSQELKVSVNTGILCTIYWLLEMLEGGGLSSPEMAPNPFLIWTYNVS